jgi:predicted small lipoprotein YifL
MPFPRVAATALLTAFALTGCGEDPVTKPATGDNNADTVSESTTDQTDASSTPDEPEEPELPTDEQVETLVVAVASRDAGELKDAIGLTKPGSLANAYVSYVAAAVDALIDGGQSTGYEVTTSKVDGGYKACFPDEPDRECLTLADFEGEDGLLVDMTVDGKALRGTIVEGSKAAKSSGALGKVEFLYGRANSDGVWVVMKMSSNDQPVNFGPYESTYRTSEGRQVTASSDGVIGPTSLAANSTATVAVLYQSVDLGGQVTMPVYSEDYTGDESVTFATK